MNNDQNEVIFHEPLSSRPPRKRKNGKKALFIVIYVLVVLALAVSAFFISNAIFTACESIIEPLEFSYEMTAEELTEYAKENNIDLAGETDTEKIREVITKAVLQKKIFALATDKGITPTGETFDEKLVFIADNLSQEDFKAIADEYKIPYEEGADLSLLVREVADALPPDPYEGYDLIPLDQSEIYMGNLVLVNEDFKYITPAKEIDLVVIRDNGKGIDKRAVVDGTPVYLTSVNGHQMTSEALEAFNLLMPELYKATGNSRVQIKRSVAVTDDLTSEHQLGLSLDLDVYRNGATYFLTDPSEEETYDWLKQNMHKYGFILRYPTGNPQVKGSCKSGHIRYVGDPHSYVIAQNNWCLEQYTAKLINDHSFDKEHLIVETESGKYEIYYFAATGTTTNVPVPKGLDYKISGNNAEGFVVTVTLS